MATRRIPARVREITQQSREIAPKISEAFASRYEAFQKEISDLKWDTIDQFIEGGDLARRAVTPAYRMRKRSNLYINRLRRAYNTLVASLAKRSPGVFLLPRVEGAELIETWSRYLNRELNAIFQQNTYPKQFLGFIGQAMAYGVGYQRVSWSPQLNDNLGGIRIRTVPSRNLVLPRGVYDPSEADYVFEINWMSIPRLIQLYPEQADEIEKLSESAGIRSEGSASSIVAKVLGYVTGPKDPGTGQQGTNYVIGDRGLVVRRSGSESLLGVVTAWFHDDSVIEEMIDEDVIRAYPYGRVMTFVGDLLLEDKPNPVQFFPYISLVNEAIPGSGKPYSEVLDLIEIEKLYSTSVNKISDAITRHVSGGRTFYDATSQLAPDLMRNEPDEYVPVGSINGIRREENFSVPADAYRLLSLFRADFDEVSGVQDIMQGKAGDLRSGFAVQAISELADATLSPKLQAVEASVSQLVGYIIRMIARFYRPGEHLPDGLEETRGLSPDLFRIVIKLGTNSTLTGPNRDLFILQLYDRGIVDEEFVLDNLTDLVGEDRLKERILARKRQMEAAAQAQAQAQGAPPTP